VLSLVLEQRLSTAVETLTPQVLMVVELVHPTLLETKSLLVAAEQ
jgi:hypothetical protein